MINLIEYISSLTEKYGIESEKFSEDFVSFLVDNDWFGYKAEVKNGKVLCTHNFIDLHGNDFELFAANYTKTEEEKVEVLYEILDRSYPNTVIILKQFITEVNAVKEFFSSTNEYYLLNFLITKLPDEITELSDDEVAYLIEDGVKELTLFNCRLLTSLFTWTKDNYKTRYIKDRTIGVLPDENNDAYGVNEYCRILFHMFNKEYIDRNSMYISACNSKNYVDTWLYISLHFICSLRNSDLVKLPHPMLPYKPKEVLEKVKEDRFTKEDSLKVINSVLWTLNFEQNPPNKTKRFTGESIKFYIPKSVEEHFGILFAIAEAHHILTGGTEEDNFIHVITTYKDISRNMGDEIGDLFLNSDFRTRSANKSYMQMIELLTDAVLENDNNFHVKGYMLAALARTHKGTFGQFSETTIRYLNDQNMTGCTPEFVARELFERGVLSYIPKMLLSMIAGKEFDQLDMRSQTEIIKELDMSAFETENTIQLAEQSIKRATEISKEIYQSMDRKEDITKILHKIGNGEAVSKNSDCLCLMTAIGKVCPYTFNKNCPICPYEISTKVTLLRMIHEVTRLKQEYKSTTDSREKGKLKQAALIVVKSLDEMITCYRDLYGNEEADLLKKMIKEINENN